VLASRVHARGWGIALAVAAGLGALYALGAWVPWWYQSPAGGASAFWPPAGLTVAALVVTPRRTWPLWLVFFGAAEFGVDVAHHESVALALSSAFANTAEPLVGALLITEFVGYSAGYRARTVAFAIFGVVVGPLVGATIGATTDVLIEARPPGWWTIAWTWWLGDALGVVVVGSVVLTWAHWSFYRRRVPLTSVPVIAALSVGTAGVVVVTAVVWHNPAVLAALPVLVWAAFAGGPLAVTAIGAAVAGATDWAALTGRSTELLASASRLDELALLQAYLGVTLLTVLVLAAEVAERRRGEHQAHRSELARVKSEEATIKIAEAERRSIAQDTHDLVGHGVNVMLLQVGAARRVLDSDPALARELLASVEEIGRNACHDLEVALTAIGGQGTPLEPGRGLADLPELVEALRTAGLRIELHVEGERGQLSKLLDWSAYRIVQEALTNVVEHARASVVTVTVRYDDHEVRVSIIDEDGMGQSGNRPYKEGRGIIGMRERALALGGTLDARPIPTGGFCVVVQLPRSPVGQEKEGLADNSIFGPA
jgi:signal transduction histidine kinase